MTDEHRDPSGDTRAFRAFAQREEPVPEQARWTYLILVIGAVGVVIALIAAVLLLLN